MDFPHNLVRTVMCGYYVSPDEAKTIGGAAWSIFDPTQHQGESARNAVYRAYRIEGVISTGAGDTIVLELSFYDKGGKKPFFTARSFFNRIHGTVCALGGYSETCG